MPNLDTSKIRRLLLVRLSAVGDILHGLPVLRALKDWRRELEIHWLVEDRFSSLLRNVNELNGILEVPRKKWKSEKSWAKCASDAIQIRKQIRDMEFDVALDMQGLTKSGIWHWMARVPVRIGFGGKDSRELHPMMINVRIKPPDTCRHVVDRNLSLLSSFGIQSPKVDLSLPEDFEAKVRIRQILQDQAWNPEKLALIQPGAGWETKRWMPEYFSFLADYLTETWGLQVVVLWGPGEQELAEGVIAGMNTPGEMAPPTSLLELVELIRTSCLFIGGDTGPMHIAAALGIPTIALFGASDPVRNGPYGEGHLVLYEELDCRPSWRTQCDHLSCLKNLTPEKVISRLEDYLHIKGFVRTTG